MDNWSEIDLIKGLKNSQEAAFKQLFLQYYVTILRFLEKITGNPYQAEDTAQNIFIKVWIGREKLDETKSIKNYLYVLAKNEALNYLKRNSMIKEEVLTDNVEAKNSSPYDEIFLKETSLTISHRVEQMPEQRKKIFILSKYQRKTNLEIAQMMNLSVRTVEKHLELAMKDIRSITIT